MPCGGGRAPLPSRTMTIHPELLRKLACPRCRGALVLLESVDESTGVEGRLACRACRVSYDVRDGLPDLIPDHARPDEAAGTDAPASPAAEPTS